jgi:hypothetical protein
MNKIHAVLVGLLILSIIVLQQQQQVKAQCNEHCQVEIKQSKKIGLTKDTNEVTGFAEIDVNPVFTSWHGSILDTSTTSTSFDDIGPNTISFPCSNGGIYSVVFQKQDEDGTLTVKIVKQGTILKQATTSAAYGLVSIAGRC